MAGNPDHPDQCADGLSSLLLVANRIDATKTAMITGTTKNGEFMCIVQAPCCSQINKLESGFQLPAFSSRSD